MLSQKNLKAKKTLVFCDKDEKHMEMNSDNSKVQNEALADFLHFLEQNKRELKTGFGAFHTNNHGNW